MSTGGSPGVNSIHVSWEVGVEETRGLGHGQGLVLMQGSQGSGQMDPRPQQAGTVLRARGPVLAAFCSLEPSPGLGWARRWPESSSKFRPGLLPLDARQGTGGHQSSSLKFKTAQLPSP